jgi:ABC-type phosphate/phosphonate transport system substrate-binding protein
VLLCGFPIAVRLARVVPMAAPIPHADWAAGRPLYRSDLIVRRDAAYQTLEQTFGGRAGFTVAHSQSGFNAFRHHLLRFRTQQRPALYREMVGNLVTARRVLDSVRDGRIDIGPLDAYWHMLIARHAPQLTADIRVLESTAPTPMPAFVAAAGAPEEMISRLREAFVAARDRPWFAGVAEPLLIDGFAAADAASYEVLLDWDRSAKAAGYELPA